MAKEGLTPMMKQFYDLKAKHPDAIMLFRCGDFYETYCEDAVVASEILGITLTKRSNGGRNGEPVEMAGFPYHALDTYLPKLIRAGCGHLRPVGIPYADQDIGEAGDYGVGDSRSFNE